MSDLEESPASDRDRMAVVQALSAARRNEELSADDQLERTELALAAETVGDLRKLVADLSTSAALPVAALSRRRLLTSLGAVTAVAVGIGTAVAVGSGDEDDPPPSPAPSSTSAAPVATASSTPVATPTPEPLPSLFTVAGLELLLADYRKEFGTWWTYELSVFGDTQARSDVPVGPLRKRRLQWWTWDADERWNTIFSPQPATQSAAAIDLRRVDLAAAVANRRVARRSVGVEDPEAPDMEFTHHPEHGPVVMFFVTNAYQESGLMFTSLDGRVVARQPFRRS